MELSEKEIILACQTGNLSGFSSLYKRYIEKIYNFTFYRTMHKETAEDITSKIFLKALKKINFYSPERGSFSSWLYGLAKNEIIDYYRSCRPTDDIESILDLSGNIDIPKQVGAGLELENIKKYLDKLTREQREIIIMRVWDGLSHKEISEITGKTEANCKVIFSRTMNKLREEMPINLFLAILLKMIN